MHGAMMFPALSPHAMVDVMNSIFLHKTAARYTAGRASPAGWRRYDSGRRLPLTLLTLACRMADADQDGAEVWLRYCRRRLTASANADLLTQCHEAYGFRAVHARFDRRRGRRLRHSASPMLVSAEISVDVISDVTRVALPRLIYPDMWTMECGPARRRRSAPARRRHSDLPRNPARRSSVSTMRLKICRWRPRAGRAHGRRGCRSRAKARTTLHPARSENCLVHRRDRRVR